MAPRPRAPKRPSATADGQVVTYKGKPVVTYFFSTSGGRTEDVENSFVGSTPKPWLKSVERSLRQHLAAPPLGPDTG